MRLVGDVHGRYKIYDRLIRGVSASVQVGDFGVGFNNKTWGGGQAGLHKPCWAETKDLSHRFIRGNHDNLSFCKTLPQWIPDGHCELIEGRRWFFVGGEASVDWAYQIEGLSWWRDEELSVREWYELIDKARAWKPEVIVAHGLFKEAIEYLASIGVIQNLLPYRSGTQSALNALLQSLESPPEYFFHGHWHQDWKFDWKGTTVVGLGINKYFDLEPRGP